MVLSTISELVPDSSALLIIGSLNAMQEDREHGARSAIDPVQIVMDGRVFKCPFFSGWGELGVSSLVITCMDPLTIYLTTGSDLVELTISTDGAHRVDLDIPGLKDVHEMAIFDNVLWLANTGFDEVVAVDPGTKRVLRRVGLDQFRKKSNAPFSVLSFLGLKREVDRFHCNQVFEGLDGKLYVLVHHVSGRQILKRIAKKFIKTHGNGGIIELDTGRGIPLSLNGPHSVRCINGGYWVCDSGERTVNVYTSDWQLTNKLPTAGWARGADLSLEHGVYYVGISAQRKRYRDRPDYNDKNMIQVFRIADGSRLGDILIPDGIEQVNNVYLVPKSMAEALLRLQ